MGLHGAVPDWPRPIRDGYLGHRTPDAPTVEPAPTSERTTAERAIAIVRDLLVIVVCLGVLYTGFRVYAALGAVADQLQPASVPQPCLIDPNAAGCGR